MCRSLEDKYRKDEAVSLKCAEFRRVREGCAKLRGYWMDCVNEGSCRGKQAYAYKQAGMWERRHRMAIEVYRSALREGVDSEQLDHHRVSATLPPCVD